VSQKPVDAHGEPKMLKLGDLNKLIGLTLSEDFLTGQGFIATRDRTARLYRESDIPEICYAIACYVLQVPRRIKDAA
jgi:hypothetical protein